MKKDFPHILDLVSKSLIIANYYWDHSLLILLCRYVQQVLCTTHITISRKSKLVLLIIVLFNIMFVALHSLLVFNKTLLIDFMPTTYSAGHRQGYLLLSDSIILLMQLLAFLVVFADTMTPTVLNDNTRELNESSKLSYSTSSALSDPTSSLLNEATSSALNDPTTMNEGSALNDPTTALLNDPTTSLLNDPSTNNSDHLIATHDDSLLYPTVIELDVIHLFKLALKSADPRSLNDNSQGLPV